MVQIEELSRDDARRERTQLQQKLSAKYETDVLAELRELSLSGQMSTDEIEMVERLRTLDFLLGE